jgi:hypothetical protein
MPYQKIRIIMFYRLAKIRQGTFDISIRMQLTVRGVVKISSADNRFVALVSPGTKRCMLLENYMSTKVFTLPVSKLQQHHYSICQQHLIEMEKQRFMFLRSAQC